MLVLVCSEIMLTLTQDSCMVCAKCTIGSKIILDAPEGSPTCQCLCQCKIGAQFVPNVAQKSFWTHPMVLLGGEAQVDACFGLF
jgi:hypothetical protein